MAASSVTAVVSVANDAVIQHNAVSFSQAGMESVDLLLPLAFGRAAAAEAEHNRGKARRWRSVANVSHMAIASVGAIEAARLMSEPYHFSASNVAISGLVGAWNLRIIRVMNSEGQEVGNERNHENLATCVASNVVEAVPAFAGPVMQLAWEHGNAGSVIAAGLTVVAMNGWQLLKDVR